MTVNRKDIARRISEETGYYIQDIEEILEAESKAIVDFIDEGQEKIKNHKYRCCGSEAYRPSSFYNFIC